MPKKSSGHDRLSLLLRWPYVLLLFALVLSTLGTVFYRYRYVVAQDKIDRYEVSYVIKKSKIGDVLDTKNFSFAVTKVEFDKTGINEFPAPPRLKFAMVSVSIHNKTSEAVGFYPIFEAYLRDELGNKYEVSTAPMITAPSIAGEIEQGVATNGILGFMVPASASSFEFIYEPRAFPDANTIIYGINE